MPRRSFTRTPVIPLLLVIVGSLRRREVKRGAFEPFVTVIMTAYNEERDLAAKLENTLALDYPPSFWK